MLLYIHIPFCDSKCNYCAFNSYTTLHHLKKEYINALKKQLIYEIEKHSIENFETLFIGGGTPSVLEIKYYEEIFKILEKFQFKEITIEANPSAKKEWIKEIKNFANRISFGVQSFNEEKLRLLNRNHSKKDAIQKIEYAEQIGFKRINLDLIYSVINDSKELLKNDLEIALNLPINHISAYSLMIEKNTKWENDYSKKLDDENLELWFIEEIKKHFFQYEISNFGDKSLHNLGYWQLKNYIGIGAGAVGFINNYRYYTEKDLNKYIENPISYSIEKLSNQNLKEEKILLGLRSIVGFNRNLLSNNEQKRVDELIKENILEEKDKIYNKKFHLANQIAFYIIDNN